MSVKQSKKPRLRDMIALEKERMLPLNFAFSYIVIPLYVVFALVMFLTIGSLTGTSNATAFLVCLVILAVVTGAFIGMFPLVRKKAIEAELKRYNIKRLLRRRDALDSQTEWDFSEKELSLCFNRYGMVLDGDLYYYNHLTKLVYTGNDYRRVGVFICFSVSEKNNILLPLSEKSLKMLDDFGVTLDNQPVLDYILAHPEKAFADIYKTGKVSLPPEE